MIRKSFVARDPFQAVLMYSDYLYQNGHRIFTNSRPNFPTANLSLLNDMRWQPAAVTYCSSSLSVFMLCYLMLLQILLDSTVSHRLL